MLNMSSLLFTGGGEGATLREVLRHDTVERAVMVEIDEGMVNASRSFLPEWSDCSNIVGSAPSCFDDIRAETYYEDAIAWFIHRYGDKADEAFKNEDGFDVIIMDALDPSSVVEFSDLLYDNDKLMAAFSTALGEGGIFVVQVGESESPRDDRPSDFGKENRLLQFRQHLIDMGFLTIVEVRRNRMLVELARS
jgi:spermidine synthase